LGKGSDVGAGYSDREWTSFDGLRLYARDYAGGPGPAKLPVVCLHGLTRNSKDFEEVASFIAATGRRVLVPDVRGRGRSARDPRPMNYVPPIYARDIVDLCKAAGIERAEFVGTSMGGLITMAITAIAPKLVAGAVLNDIGPQVAKAGLVRIAGYTSRKVQIDSWEDAAGYIRSVNQVAFPMFGDEDWRAFARRTFRTGPDGKPQLDYDPDISVPIKAAGPKALTPNLWPWFRKLAKDRPLLLVRGERSDLLDEPIAAKMRKAAPQMAYVEAPGVGHAPMLTEPEAKGAILEFLEKAA
jgi:pimeloyl-ACP methyl ester carboxylesterase